MTLKISCYLLLLAGTLASCSHFGYQPAPVVPTKSPLAYSAKVRLVHVGSYLVEPGSTLITDPRIENHVTNVSTSSLAQKEWERSIIDYLSARRTFTYISTDSQTDLDIFMRLNIYIDPGMMSQFNHTYLARAEASLTNPRTGRTLNYFGLGKAPGEVSRGGTKDDQLPINFAVQTALNELFGKIENDSRLR